MNSGWDSGWILLSNPNLSIAEAIIGNGSPGSGSHSGHGVDKSNSCTTQGSQIWPIRQLMVDDLAAHKLGSIWWPQRQPLGWGRFGHQQWVAFFFWDTFFFIKMIWWVGFFFNDKNDLDLYAIKYYSFKYHTKDQTRFLNDRRYAWFNWVCLGSTKFNVFYWI